MMAAITSMTPETPAVAQVQRKPDGRVIRCVVRRPVIGRLGIINRCGHRLHINRLLHDGWLRLVVSLRRWRCLHGLVLLICLIRR